MSPVTLQSSRPVGKIYATRDYKKFKVIKGNRDINPEHLDEMVRARKAGVKINHIVTVYEYKGYYYIIDGQHTWKSAEKTGQEFEFRVIKISSTEDAVEIILKMNCKQKSWTSLDYRKLWIDRGRVDYISLRDFQENAAIENVDLSIVLLGTDQSSRSMKVFREGGYKFGNKILAEKRISLLNDFAEQLDYAWTRNFVRAVCQLSVIGNYNHKRMLTKLRRRGMKKQASTELYMEAIRSIYNSGNGLRDNERI